MHASVAGFFFFFFTSVDGMRFDM